MPKNQSSKGTPEMYNQRYHENIIRKYRDRKHNHRQSRYDLAHRLVDEYALPRFKNRPLGDIILVDIASSIGAFAIQFAKRGFRSYAVDFAPEAVEIGKKLAEEEAAKVEFICADITDLPGNFPRVDIAFCFDIFEHLHDDQLGIFLHSIRKHLSEDGCLIFHTFPTEYDHIFFRKNFVRYPLIPFKNFSPKIFNIITKIYSDLVDIWLLATKGATYKDIIRCQNHCNPTTKERLSEILIRSGYEILYIKTSQLYPFGKDKIQKQFKKQPIVDRSLYGVAVLKVTRD